MYLGYSKITLKKEENMARGRLRGLCVMLENNFTHLLHSTSIKVMPENYFTHIVWFT
jgi:hypothetical protein